MENVLEYLSKNKNRFVGELSEFISIPSVSALPEHFGDIEKASKWLKERLVLAGIENSEIMETGGHPSVYGDWLHAGPDKPTILVYGHFDVQPVDPIELWENDPFSGIVKGERIFGRGASDDKGSMLIPIISFESILKCDGRFPVNIKFLFEGQEEIASPDMPEFVYQNKEKLSCDMIFSADGGQFSETEPNLVVGLKGILGLEIKITGPNSDKHSGMHGNAIENPIMALSKIISSMKDEDGRIAVTGFYDDVIELSNSEREEISKVPFNESNYINDMGVKDVSGEKGYTTLERMGARPSLDLNGIWGGFQGKGTKTVLPSEATAKITCRLVSNQNPKKIFELIKAHVLSNLPKGVTAEVISLQDEGEPFQVPENHLSTDIAREVLKEVYNKDPYIIRIGGSIPILSAFLTHLGVHGTMFAFGLDDENIHAPNEFFRLSSFVKGQEAYCRLFYRLGVVENGNK